MLTIILCILFSSKLSFVGLTVANLLAWFNVHPFLALTALFDIMLGVGIIVNELTYVIINLPHAGYDEEDFRYSMCHCDDCKED